jgi:hypothetical protein
MNWQDSVRAHQSSRSRVGYSRTDLLQLGTHAPRVRIKSALCFGELREAPLVIHQEPRTSHLDRWSEEACEGRATNLCHFLVPRTSTSSSSIMPKTTPKLSMKPFTATLNILFVVALYSVLRIVSSGLLTRVGSSVPNAEVEDMVEKDRRTRGESSLSTLKA